MTDRRYETLVVIHPDQGEGGAKDLAGRIKDLITGQAGTIEQVQEWGLRELAFLIEKQRRAFYVLYEYRATPSALQEIERNLHLMDAVLRFVSVRRAENAPLAGPRPTSGGERESAPEDDDGSADMGSMPQEGL
jgi:small subunit ribosomal protein S6